MAAFSWPFMATANDCERHLEIQLLIASMAKAKGGFMHPPRWWKYMNFGNLKKTQQNKMFKDAQM